LNDDVDFSKSPRARWLPAAHPLSKSLTNRFITRFSNSDEARAIISAILTHFNKTEPVKEIVPKNFLQKLANVGRVILELLEGPDFEDHGTIFKTKNIEGNIESYIYIDGNGHQHLMHIFNELRLIDPTSGRRLEDKETPQFYSTAFAKIMVGFYEITGRILSKYNNIASVHVTLLTENKYFRDLLVEKLGFNVTGRMGPMLGIEGPAHEIWTLRLNIKLRDYR